jgi:RES domain-containing protein
LTDEKGVTKNRGNVGSFHEEPFCRASGYEIPMKLHPESTRLRTALEKCVPRLVVWEGELFRSASPKYANKDDLITGAGSKAAGARWNPPGGFHTVYASLDVETAVAEALQHFRYFGLPVSKAMPRVIVALEAKLERVVDLGDGDVRRVLGVSEKRMLSEPWREEQKQGREALTQAVGRLAFDLDVQALLVPSAARKGGSNLILFPANLDPPTSWLRIVNRDELPRKT